MGDAETHIPGAGAINDAIDLASTVYHAIAGPPHQAGTVTVETSRVDWRPVEHMNAVQYEPAYNPVLTLTARHDLYDEDEGYFLQIMATGRFSGWAHPPAITECYFYADDGNGRIGDDTRLDLQFHMSDGLIGQVGQYWVIPFTIQGLWHVRHEIQLHLHGNGEITQEGGVLWNGIQISPPHGHTTSSSGFAFGGQWEANFHPHSNYATGHLEVMVHDLARA